MTDPTVQGDEQSPAARRTYFDSLYQSRTEPWEYSRFGAEVLRHDHVARLARSLPTSPPRRVLDIGCSLGQLTGRLVGIGPELHAIDISPLAARQAREHCVSTAHDRGLDPAAGRPALHFYAGSATDLPFRSETFDLLLLCDGIISWRLNPRERTEVMEQVFDLAVPGGYVILTDALKQAQIEPFIQQVEQSPLEVVSVELMNDRLWYSLERAVRPIRDRGATQAVLASRRVARGLSLLSRLGGRRGSKHVCILARRPLSSAGAA